MMMTMEHDHYEIELTEKDFDLVLMVLVYDGYDGEMMTMMRVWMLMMYENMVMHDDLIYLFVVMNVEMNLKNDLSGYYDDLNDYVSVIENDFVKKNDLRKNFMHEYFMLLGLLYLLVEKFDRLGYQILNSSTNSLFSY